MWGNILRHNLVLFPSPLILTWWAQRQKGWKWSICSYLASKLPIIISHKGDNYERKLLFCRCKWHSAQKWQRLQAWLQFALVECFLTGKSYPPPHQGREMIPWGASHDVTILQLEEAFPSVADGDCEAKHKLVCFAFKGGWGVVDTHIILCTTLDAVIQLNHLTQW